MKDVLIVDDEPGICEALGDLLKRAGRSSASAGDRAAGLERLGSGEVRSLLLDLRMPGVEGLDLLKEVRDRFPRLPVIMITAHGTVKTAVEAMKLGAFDFITKPLDREELLASVGKALRQSDAEDGTSELFFHLPRDARAVFRDPRSAALVAEVQKAATVELPALITGESGAGKEVFALLLHQLGARKAGPFIKVNCAAIPETLFESELFGHEKGAFTGAVTAKPGRVEIADKGTLFLDEIGELPQPAQAKLLQFLQDRTYERVGGVRTLKADVRVVAATNRDLREAFRQDLLFRLNGITLEVPPLRERPGDIEPLVRHYLERQTKKLSLAPGAIAGLRAYAWPGNVRELEHRVERAAAFATGPLLAAHDIVPLESKPEGLRDEKKEFEKRRVAEALRETKGNRTHAAEKLGISRRMLQKKLKEFGIE
ncbi:MAG: sigma-54-dependent Fis family transcriptional regulator [Planctomycetes bacterium]|nr:sigma-54-dependent Fis family transcriptional regulator [Planctomycetota bacterium]